MTALAAGHRPCFFCQRQRAKEFAGRFGEAFGIADPKAPEIDARLHRERLASGGRMVELDRHGLKKLPDGAVIFDGEADYAIHDGKALRWTFSGYDRVVDFYKLGSGEMCIVTPATTHRRAQPGIPAGVARECQRLDPITALPHSSAMRANYKMQRLYVPQDLASGAAIEASPEQSHYLA